MQSPPRPRMGSSLVLGGKRCNVTGSVFTNIAMVTAAGLWGRSKRAREAGQSLHSSGERSEGQEAWSGDLCGDRTRLGFQVD